MKIISPTVKYIVVSIIVGVSVLLIFQYISEQKNEIKGLKQQLDKYINRDAILSKYTFDPEVGIYRSKNESDKLSYCPKCLLEKNIESPLKPLHPDWLCPVCNSHYAEPRLPRAGPRSPHELFR